jgi:EmrB/QacA subfamily drug resistance transporter
MTETAIPLALTPARRKLAFYVLLLGALLPSLNMFTVTIALPAIRDALGASASETSLIVAGYSAAYAVCLITGGRLGDLFGRRRLYIVGMTGFTVASLVAGLAPDPTTLIVGRVFLGIFAAAMAPQVLAAVRTLFTNDKVPWALNIYGTGIGVAVAGGQLLGGLLIAADIGGLGWRVAFLFNVPIGICAIVAAVAFVPESGGAAKPRLDVIGVVLMSLALGLLVVGLSIGREHGWSLMVLAMLVAAPILIVVFFGYEQRLTRAGGMPLLDMSLLQITSFRRGLLVAFLFFFTTPFYLFFSLYLQAGLGEGALAAGLAVLPYGVANFVGPMLATRAGPKLRRWLFGIGMALEVAGYAGVALCAATQTGGVVLFAVLFTGGFGQGVAMPEMFHFILGDVPPANTGLAAGIMSSTLQIGASISVAAGSSLFFATLGSGTGAAAYGHALGLMMATQVIILGVSMLLGLRTQRRNAALTQQRNAA